LRYNEGGSYNTAVGSQALHDNTEGNGNTAIGYTALDDNTDGLYNNALGQAALSANTEGDRNVAIGSGALNSNTLGDYNTAVGNYSLSAQNGNSADSNTALGHQAGNLITTGSQNVIIGKDADPSVDTGTNQIVIGFEAEGQGNGYAVIGDENITRLYAAQDGGAVLYADSTVLSSDGRLKENIKPIAHGLDFIKKLNPVSYDKMQVGDFLNNKTSSKLKFEIGLVAQEVKKASESLNFKTNIVTIDEDGIYRMDYQKITMPLIKAVQEQQETIDSQNKEIESLNERLEKIEKMLNAGK